MSHTTSLVIKKIYKPSHASWANIDLPDGFSDPVVTSHRGLARLYLIPEDCQKSKQEVYQRLAEAELGARQPYEAIPKRSDYYQSAPFGGYVVLGILKS